MVNDEILLLIPDTNIFNYLLCVSCLSNSFKIFVLRFYAIGAMRALQIAGSIGKNYRWPSAVF